MIGNNAIGKRWLIENSIDDGMMRILRLIDASEGLDGMDFKIGGKFWE